MEVIKNKITTEIIKYCTEFQTTKCTTRSIKNFQKNMNNNNKNSLVNINYNSNNNKNRNNFIPFTL